MPGIDFAGLRKRNQAALKKLENGGSARYLYALSGRKAVLVIGTGDPALEETLRKGNAYAGTITVTKGTLADPGQLKFTGVKANRRELEDELKLFTKKKVVYS
jgi:hypothetical protein